MRRIIVIIIAIISILPLCSVLANVESDPVFRWITATLTSQKEVSFSLRTISVSDEIKVDQCYLQKYENGSWTSTSLTPPSYVAQNSPSYVKTVDYSANIGTGTYRIKYRANADGYTVIRYSNSYTY